MTEIRSNKPAAELVIELVASFGPKLYGYIFSQMRDRHEAEDLLQDSFFELLKVLKKNSGGIKNHQAYLFQISRRLIINRKKSANRRNFLERQNIPPLLLAKQASDWKPGDLEMLEKTLSALPEDQAEVFVLRVFMEMTFEEIAALTDGKLQSVVYRYNAAKEKLQRLLEPYHEA